MARYNCEAFGVICYSLEISYHDLYTVEEEVISGLQQVLERYNATHLDFWGYGDTLQFQFSLDEYSSKLFHDICEEICPMLGKDITARLVFVDKRLKGVAAYALSAESWTEQGLDLDPEDGKN